MFNVLSKYCTFIWSPSETFEEQYKEKFQNLNIANVSYLTFFGDHIWCLIYILLRKSTIWTRWLHVFIKVQIIWNFDLQNQKQLKK